MYAAPGLGTRHAFTTETAGYWVSGERCGHEHSPWSSCSFTGRSIPLSDSCASCEFQVKNVFLNFIIISDMDAKDA